MALSFSVHRIASLTQALPNELNRTQYAYVLADHERHPFAFPDNKMLADLPNVSLEGQDITHVNVPINIHGHKWHPYGFTLLITISSRSH
ncbi:hypothetical protein P4S73_24860 [Paraglaciecola sp. Hal342]